MLSGRLLAHALAGLAVRGVEVGGKLLLYVAVAHRFGAAPAGLFFVALNWLTLGSGLARMGLERALMRHVPAELAAGRAASARHLLAWTATRVTLGAAAVGGLTVLLGPPAARYLMAAPEYGVPLMLSAAILVPDALAITAGNVLVALKRPLAAQLVQNALWAPMALCCVLAGLADVPQVLLATAACRLATLALGVALIWRNRAPLLAQGASAPGVTLPQLWRTARPLYVVELIQGAQISVPTLVLGAFASSAAVGAFSAANRLSMLTYVVLLSIASVTTPHFAEHHGTERWPELRRVNRTARLAAAGLALPMLALMMLLAPWLLELVGPGFSVASGALRLLALGQMANAALSGQDILLAMTGHARALRGINLLSFTACLLLSAVAIPFAGLTGAATATAITLALGAAATTLVARRRIPQAF